MPERIDLRPDITAGGTDPAQMMAALDRLIDQVVGMKMCTLVRVDLDQVSGMRIHSTQPDQFPIRTLRPIGNRTWQTRIVARQEVLVTNTHDETAAVFGDADALRDLGCESCLCLPIAVQGKLLGTLNILHEAGYFTPERVAAAEALKMPAAIILMASFELDGIPTPDQVDGLARGRVDGVASSVVDQASDRVEDEGSARPAGPAASDQTDGSSRAGSGDTSDDPSS